MITRNKVDEYIWARGDIDGYVRSGRSGDVTTVDWIFLDQMVSAITMIRRELASDSFQEEHKQIVEREFDSQDTYDALKNYERMSEPQTEGLSPVPAELSQP